MTSFQINGRAVTVDLEEATPLLWVIRDVIGLTGTKFGCGIGMCGACHTPRNLLGAVKAGEAYGGAVIDNWVAPPL